jgi:hypothetical protein
VVDLFYFRLGSKENRHAFGVPMSIQNLFSNTKWNKTTLPIQLAKIIREIRQFVIFVLKKSRISGSTKSSLADLPLLQPVTMVERGRKKTIVSYFTTQKGDLRLLTTSSNTYFTTLVTIMNIGFAIL